MKATKLSLWKKLGIQNRKLQPANLSRGCRARDFTAGHAPSPWPGEASEKSLASIWWSCSV